MLFKCTVYIAPQGYECPRLHDYWIGHHLSRNSRPAKPEIKQQWLCHCALRLFFGGNYLNGAVYVLFYLTTTLWLIVSAKCAGEPFYAAISDALNMSTAFFIYPISKLFWIDYLKVFLRNFSCFVLDSPAINNIKTVLVEIINMCFFL